MKSSTHFQTRTTTQKKLKKKRDDDDDDDEKQKGLLIIINFFQILMNFFKLIWKVIWSPIEKKKKEKEKEEEEEEEEEEELIDKRIKIIYDQKKNDQGYKYKNEIYRYQLKYEKFYQKSITDYIIKIILDDNEQMIKRKFLKMYKKVQKVLMVIMFENNEESEEEEKGNEMEMEMEVCLMMMKDDEKKKEEMFIRKIEVIFDCERKKIVFCLNDMIIEVKDYKIIEGRKRNVCIKNVVMMFKHIKLPLKDNIKAYEVKKKGKCCNVRCKHPVYYDISYDCKEKGKYCKFCWMGLGKNNDKEKERRGKLQGDYIQSLLIYFRNRNNNLPLEQRNRVQSRELEIIRKLNTNNSSGEDILKDLQYNRMICYSNRGSSSGGDGTLIYFKSRQIDVHSVFDMERWNDTVISFGVNCCTKSIFYPLSSIPPTTRVGKVPVLNENITGAEEHNTYYTYICHCNTPSCVLKDGRPQEVDVRMENDIFETKIGNFTYVNEESVNPEERKVSNSDKKRKMSSDFPSIRFKKKQKLENSNSSNVNAETGRFLEKYAKVLLKDDVTYTFTDVSIKSTRTKRIDKNLVDEYNRTALFYCCATEKESFVRENFKGCKVDHKDMFGCSALFYSKLYNNKKKDDEEESVCDYLIRERGANVNIKNNEGLDYLQYSTKYSF